MLQKLYRDQCKRNWCNRSWLIKYVNPYLRYLSSRGYKKSTLLHYGGDLVRFGYFVEQDCQPKIMEFSKYIESLFQQYPYSKWIKRTTRTTLNQFLKYLQTEGVVNTPRLTTPKDRRTTLVSQFVGFQREHRGICLEYSKNLSTYCTKFLDYLWGKNIKQLRSLKPELIFEFITTEGKHYTRRTMSSRCSMLRVFLSYLYRHGVIFKDLSTIVVAPRMYRYESCPRFLTDADIRAVLSVVNQNTPKGRRDYAMMLMLVTYGLRGIEVIRLQLDDIDWHNNTLCIRTRKAGNNTVYPLALSVGEAILDYLQKDRPKSNDRHVFLSVKAPYQPLVYTYSIGYQIRKYMALAGIKVDRPGTHTFRYSCAQKLLEHGMPLKTIGDYLGHRLPATTQGYTKIAINQLREVALGYGEELL